MSNLKKNVKIKKNKQNFGSEQEPKKNLKQKIKTKAKSVTRSIHDHPAKASLAALAVVGAATVTAVSMGTLGPESAMVAGSAIAAVEGGEVAAVGGGAVVAAEAGAGGSLLTTAAGAGAVATGASDVVKGGKTAVKTEKTGSIIFKGIKKTAKTANDVNDINTAVNSGIDTVNKLTQQDKDNTEQQIQKGMTDVSTQKNSFGKKKNYKKRKISKRQAIEILKKLYRKNLK